MSTVQVLFHVQDPNAHPISGALIRAQSDHGPWQGVTNHVGDFSANLTPGEYYITVTADGFQPRDIEAPGVPAKIGNPGTITIGLNDATTALPRIHAGRWDFITDDGVRTRIVGSTELMLAYRYDQEGPDAIRAVLRERQTCGFTNLRVLWQKGRGSNGLTSPWSMPLEKLRPFLAQLAEYGFYCEGVILADCQDVNPSVAAQQGRVNAVRQTTVGITNNIEELGNEYQKNFFDPKNFTQPFDRLAANASAVEGGEDAPYWDFFCFSGRRSPVQAAIREYGPVEFLYGDRATWGGLPAICDEGFKPGQQSSDPRDWERAGAQARSCNGGRFHSDAGTAGNSRLFVPLEFACATAFVQGMIG